MTDYGTDNIHIVMSIDLVSGEKKPEFASHDKKHLIEWIERANSRSMTRPWGDQTLDKMFAGSLDTVVHHYYYVVSVQETKPEND